VNDRAIGKRMVEEMVLGQVLDSFPTITGRTVTDEWNDAAVQVEGSPDFIIGIDGKAFGLELTEICRVGDAWGYVDEAYRLASRKSESYRRRQIFRFPIALIRHSERPPLFDIEDFLKDAIWRDDFEKLGFAEIWAIDFSDEYYSPGHPFRLADMFCFKPAKWFGFHRVGFGERKPYG
jgi:hypothetical protein